jgi:hypothetical protein
MELKTGYYDNNGQPQSIEYGQKNMLRTSELVNRYNQHAYVPITKNYLHKLISDGVIVPNGYFITIKNEKINTYSLPRLMRKINWYNNETPVMKNGKHVMDYYFREDYKKFLGIENSQPTKKEIQQKKSDIFNKQKSWYDPSIK